MCRNVSRNRNSSFELLEQRRVLSSSLQVDALRGIDGVHPDDPAIAKIGYELPTIANALAASQDSLPAALFDLPLLSKDRDAILVEAVATSKANSAKLSEELRVLGMSEIAVAGRMVAGMLPITSIDALRTLDTLAFARPSYASTKIGLADTQGDVAQRTEAIRDFLGIDGTGVTVGVLSDSYDTSPTAITSAPDDVATGDLPGIGNPNNHLTPVNVLNDFGAATTIDEGRAMLQIIHDLAPGADLAFATAFATPAAFDANIRLLAAPIAQGGAEADVIVDDIIYFAEPFFQDGIVAQAANDVVADGSIFVSAAGNFEGQSYENAFNAHATATGPRGGAFHDFGGGDFCSLLLYLLVALFSCPFNGTNRFSPREESVRRATTISFSWAMTE